MVVVVVVVVMLVGGRETNVTGDRAGTTRLRAGDGWELEGLSADGRKGEALRCVGAGVA